MQKKILFVTEERSKFSGQDMPLESFEVVGIDYVSFLNLSQFSSIILNKNHWVTALRKVNLGIRDDDRSQTLWDMVYNNHPKVYFLIQDLEAPCRDMLNLGISYTREKELANLLKVETTGTRAKKFTDELMDLDSRKVLTADDIRDLKKQGVRTLPPNAQLTEWAKEVAETLKISKLETKLVQLFPLKIKSLLDLKTLRTDIFELARERNLYFIINPLFIPSFNEEFPILKGRTVSSTVHWASHGAFTGEVSAAMLSDLNCFGAIIPNNEPYTEETNLNKLVTEAKDKNLKLFSTFTFENEASYDIIQLEVLKNLGIIQIYKEALGLPQDEEVGVLVDNKALEGKGMK